MTRDQGGQIIDTQATQNGHACSAIGFGVAPAAQDRGDRVISTVLCFQSDRTGSRGWNPVCAGRYGSEPAGAKGRQLRLEPGGPLSQRGAAAGAIEFPDDRCLPVSGMCFPSRPFARLRGLFVGAWLRAWLRATRRGCHPEAASVLPIALLDSSAREVQRQATAAAATSVEHFGPGYSREGDYAWAADREPAVGPRGRKG